MEFKLNTQLDLYITKKTIFFVKVPKNVPTDPFEPFYSSGYYQNGITIIDAHTSIISFSKHNTYFMDYASSLISRLKKWNT